MLHRLSGTHKMNKTLIEFAQQHFQQPSPVHFSLLLAVAVILACCLITALCVLCNVGGTLDCIYAAQKRSKQQRRTALQVPAADVDSDEPLLPVAAPVASITSPSSASAHPLRNSFRAQSQPPRTGGYISGGGKYQNTRPFGDPRSFSSSR
jgi:hypothetical protein